VQSGKDSNQRKAKAVGSLTGLKPTQGRRESEKLQHVALLAGKDGNARETIIEGNCTL